MEGLTGRRSAGTLLFATILLLPAVACRRPSPGAFEIRAACASGAAEAVGLTFPEPPELRDITVDHVRRRAVVTQATGWRWRGEIVAGAWLRLAVALPEGEGRGSAEIRLVATAGSETRTLWSERIAPGTLWLDRRLELGGLVPGRWELAATATSGSAGTPLEIAWGEVELGTAAARAADRRPNLLLVVVDTLRADHTTPYGYARATTPELQNRLAAKGAVLERAYAQAPWTLPSVASYLTGRPPGEFLGGVVGAYGVPAELPTLAERLRESGYETAAFVANPTLHEGAGFARGFDIYYTPAYELGSLDLHADQVNRRALPWLRAAGGDRPFFLYVHYLDPHDPYLSPELVDGLSPFFPGYRGRIRGGDVHRLYAGALSLSDPVADVSQLAALYDSEVHFADHALGELIEAVPAAVMRETLTVFTADHGEELFDHGGLKHGQSLYDEQIRVPLVVRWDGRIRPGIRLPGIVRLLDLAPTLLAAAGAPPLPGPGVDLLAALRGERATPRLSAPSRHFSGGPLRAALALDQRKLVLFDRAAPFAPPDELQAVLWRRDLERFAAVELYDLASDPGEKRNLAATEPGEVARLGRLLERQLDLELVGMRLFVTGLAAGERVQARLRCARPVVDWRSLFLQPGDTVRREGEAFRFDFAGSGPARGALLEGCEEVEAIEATLNGAALPPARMRIGDRAPYRGGPIPASALMSSRWPEPGDGVELRIWRRAGEKPRDASPDEETIRRLRALGYVR